VCSFVGITSLRSIVHRTQFFVVSFVVASFCTHKSRAWFVHHHCATAARQEGGKQNSQLMIG
jgi:hypothetical protein